MAIRVRHGRRGKDRKQESKEKGGRPAYVVSLL
jgi:hypothetical protein